MSFPSNPTNDQIYTVGGVKYKWNSSNLSWTKVPADNTEDYTYNNIYLNKSLTINGKEWPGPVFHAYATTSTTLSTNNVFVKILLGAVDFDTHNAFNTANSTYTIPVSGIYCIDGSINALNSKNTYDAGLYKNSSLAAPGGAVYSELFTAASGNVVSSASVSTIIPLLKGESIDLRGSIRTEGGISTNAVVTGTDPATAISWLCGGMIRPL